MRIGRGAGSAYLASGRSKCDCDTGQGGVARIQHSGGNCGAVRIVGLNAALSSGKRDGGCSWPGRLAAAIRAAYGRKRIVTATTRDQYDSQRNKYFLHHAGHCYYASENNRAVPPARLNSRFHKKTMFVSRAMRYCAPALNDSFKIFGVTKIKSSTLSSTLRVWRNNAPTIGRSPSSGTLSTLLLRVCSLMPPSITVSPFSTSTWVFTSRVLMLGTLLKTAPTLSWGAGGAGGARAAGGSGG